MERKMEEVEVYVGEKGHICIATHPPCEDEQIIIVHPDQVDILIKWLQEAKAEIQSKEDIE